MNDTQELPLVLRDVSPEGVCTLTLNRPAKYNAFTKEMILQWQAHLQWCKEEESVKTVVLTGSGKAFCSGGDVGAQSQRLGSSAMDQKHHLFNVVHRIALEMERFDKPVIAAINGLARGAGLDMALMCDMRVMDETATVAESYIDVGLIAGDGGSWYLPRLVGVELAMDLSWTGRVIAAEEALRIGLISRVARAGQALVDAQALGRQIAAQPAQAIRFYKRAIRQGRAMPLEAHLDMVSSHMAILRQTPEHKDRVRGFMNRRKPEKRA